MAGWHWQWRQRAFALEMTAATVREHRIIAFSRETRVTHRRTDTLNCSASVEVDWYWIAAAPAFEIHALHVMLALQCCCLDVCSVGLQYYPVYALHMHGV